MTFAIVPAGNPGTMTGPGNNTYFIDGPEPALIDAGVGLQPHLDAVAALLRGRPLARVIVTHGHPDHASGAPALAARWPGLTACKWLDVPEPGWIQLGDGDEVVAGDKRLRVVHTPGHAADHICLWDVDARDVYCGDLMTADTTILVPPRARGGSLRSYLDSLRRIAALDPVRALPGHGPIITEPSARIDVYLAHRAEREQQVIACLTEGTTDLDAIVARVYAETPHALWPAARLAVEAQLEKLHEDAHPVIRAC